MKVNIKIKTIAGDFGENKDKARAARIKYIMPALLDGKEVVLDFTGISAVTQSFMHALIAEPIREFPDTFFSLVTFKGCSKQVQQMAQMVSEYTQDSID